MTKLSDVIITVVTDDKAMKKIFHGGLLSRSRGKLFINCATITPEVHVWVEAKARKGGRASARSLHGLEHHPGAARHALPDVRRQTGGVRARETDPRKAERRRMRYIGPAGQAAQVKALVNMVMNINTAGLAEGLGLGTRSGWT